MLESDGDFLGVKAIGLAKHGEKQMMNPSTHDRIKGEFHEVKGKLNEKVGQLTNDAGLEAAGKAESLGAQVQTIVSQVEKVFER